MHVTVPERLGAIFKLQTSKGGCMYRFINDSDAGSGIAIESLYF
jgi:hypothetical protein